jgi:hypothetical protein
MRILLGGGGGEEDILKANITKMGYEYPRWMSLFVQLDTTLFCTSPYVSAVHMTVTVRPYLFITAYLPRYIHGGCSFCFLLTAQPVLTQGVSTFHVSIISGVC